MLLNPNTINNKPGLKLKCCTYWHIQYILFLSEKWFLWFCSHQGLPKQPESILQTGSGFKTPEEICRGCAGCSERTRNTVNLSKLFCFLKWMNRLQRDSTPSWKVLPPFYIGGFFSRNNLLVGFMIPSSDAICFYRKEFVPGGGGMWRWGSKLEAKINEDV